MHAYKDNKKGSFLILALWLFTLLSIFCLGLGFRTFIATKKTKLLLDSVRAHTLASSGVKLAIKILEEDKEGEENVDHLQEEWAKEKEEKEVFLSPKRVGSLTLNIEDEYSRLDINSASQEKLNNLFEQEGVESYDTKVKYILDYIDEDADPLSGNPESEEDVKNEPLNALEELLLIKNITKDDYESLGKLLTVFLGDAGKKVNINTAGRDMLGVLLDIVAPDKKEEVFSVRFGLNGIEGDEDDGYYGEGGEDVPSEIENDFKTTTDIFRIKSESEIRDANKKITCVFNRNSGKILYWNEK